MKKIFLTTMLFILVLPIQNVFAASYLLTNGSVYSQVSDDSLSTYISIGGVGSNTNLYTNLDNVTISEFTYYATDHAYSYLPVSGLTFKFYDSNNLLIKSLTASDFTMRQWVDIADISNVNRIAVTHSDSKSGKIYDLKFKVSLGLSPISNLTETHNYNSVTLSWNKPTQQDFNGVLIKQNGLQIADLDSSYTTFTVNNLNAQTSYTFDVIAQYTDGLSDPKSISVTTEQQPLPSGEIIDLEVKPEYNRVELTWTLPNSGNLKHVNIYRNNVKILETSGISYSDLTVEPNKNYEYKLTTVSTDGIESTGIIKQVTTPMPPPPNIQGGEFEKNENGDYTYYWTAPTTGQIKVLIGGELYKTVNASDLQITIPANDMKFNILGVPDVKLVPVDEFGQDGEPVKPPSSSGGTGGAIDSVKIPFGANELLKTSAGFLWLVGGFVLLSLAFLLVPKLRQMLFKAVGKDKKNINVDERRFKSDIDDKERVERDNKELRQTRHKETKERLTRVRERTLKEPRLRMVKAERQHREPRMKAHRERLTRAERGL